VFEQATVTINRVGQSHWHAAHQWQKPHDASSLLIVERKPAHALLIQRFLAQG